MAHGLFGIADGFTSLLSGEFDRACARLSDALVASDDPIVQLPAGSKEIVLSYAQERTLRDGRTQQIRASTRPVRSVDGDVRLNRALWTLAAEMAKIKSAA